MRRHDYERGQVSRWWTRLWQIAPPLGVSVGIGCGTVVDPESPHATRFLAKQPTIDVTVEQVRAGSISHRIFAPASLVARRVSQIGAEVPGRIQEVFAQSGDRVAADAPLFRIDPWPRVEFRTLVVPNVGESAMGAVAGL